MVTQAGTAETFRQRGNLSANCATRAARWCGMSNRGHYKSVNKGIPALVCVPTGKEIIIDGKRYKVLKLIYDLKGEYMPLASIRPH